MIRDLSRFQKTLSLSLKFRLAAWIVIQKLLFSNFLSPNLVRIFVARVFGAKIGKRVVIRAGVRIQFPWRLEIGSQSWIGEGVWFINHEFISVGSNVCISQSVLICSSSHSYKSSTFEYNHKRVIIQDGAWICVRSVVLPGSEIGSISVVSAGEIFSGILPSDFIYRDRTQSRITM